MRFAISRLRFCVNLFKLLFTCKYTYYILYVYRDVPSIIIIITIELSHLKTIFYDTIIFKNCMCTSPGGLNNDFVSTLYSIIDFIIRIYTYCFFFIDENLVEN